MTVFLEPGDPERYLALVARTARRYRVDLWAYCLMPNHVHWIACPETPEGLARSFGEAHRSYAVALHRGREWTGHLWQQRFFSCPLDELQLLRVVRYVLLNPVRAGIADHVLDWRYSSARTHLHGDPDPAVNPGPLDARIDDWPSLLGAAPSAEDLRQIRDAVRIGSFARANRPRGRPRLTPDLALAPDARP
jgi:putative transposase